MTRKHGELEAEVLHALWSLEESGATNIGSQDILKTFEPSGSIALTTLLTILSRLCDKELVRRRKLDGKSLVFESVLSRDEQAAASLLELLEGSHNPSLVVANFVDSLSPEIKDALRSSLRKDK